MALTLFSAGWIGIFFNFTKSSAKNNRTVPHTNGTALFLLTLHILLIRANASYSRNLLLHPW